MSVDTAGVFAPHWVVQRFADESAAAIRAFIVSSRREGFIQPIDCIDHTQARRCPITYDDSRSPLPSSRRELALSVAAGRSRIIMRCDTLLQIRNGTVFILFFGLDEQNVSLVA